jgi:hypothetical protein
LPPQEFAPDDLNAGQRAMIQNNDFARMLAERQATLNWAAGPVRPVIVVQAPVTAAAPAAAGPGPAPGIYRARVPGPGPMYWLGMAAGYTLRGLGRALRRLGWL